MLLVVISLATFIVAVHAHPVSIDSNERQVRQLGSFNSSFPQAFESFQGPFQGAVTSGTQNFQNFQGPFQQAAEGFQGPVQGAISQGGSYFGNPQNLVQQPPFGLGGQRYPDQQGLVGRTEAKEPVAILSYENTLNDDGSYKFSFESADGIKREESGEQKVVGEPPEAGTIARGSYSYTDPDGNAVAIQYIADEGGFRASGPSVPTPPPVPPVIMRAIETAAAADAARNGGLLSPAYQYFFSNYRKQY